MSSLQMSFEMKLRPESETSHFSDNDPDHVCLSSLYGNSITIKRNYSKRHTQYDYLVKWLYWEKIRREKIPTESYLIDLIPDVHWMIDTWKPKFREDRVFYPDFFATRVHGVCGDFLQFVIPEVIRHYVDFINSVDIAKDILKNNFVGIVNFIIILGDKKYCHLIYDSEGKITLGEGLHPDADFSLSGENRYLSMLFHSGKKDISESFNELQRIDRVNLAHLAKEHKNDKNIISVYEKWFNTLLLVEYTLTTHFNQLSERHIEKCVVSFDKHNRFQIQIHYYDSDCIRNFYPKSVYESICIFELVFNNLMKQVWQRKNQIGEEEYQEMRRRRREIREERRRFKESAEYRIVDLFISNVGYTKINPAAYHEHFFDEVWEKIVKDEEVTNNPSIIPSLKDAYEGLKFEITDVIRDMKRQILSPEFKQELKSIYDKYLACFESPEKSFEERKKSLI